MLARIVAGPHGVVADLVGGAGPGTALAAVGRLGLPHHALHDFAKLERRAAGRVFLVAVVHLENLHVGPAADTLQERSGPAHEVHRDVHRQAHARRLEHRNLLGGRREGLTGRSIEARRRHDQRHLLLHARGNDPGHCLREREVDHDVGGTAPGIRHGYSCGRQSGERARVDSALRMPLALDRGHEPPRVGIACGTRDHALPHPASGTVHDETKRLSHRVRSPARSRRGGCPRSPSGSRSWPGSRRGCRALR